MPNGWGFFNPVRVRFGWGLLADVGGLVRGRTLIVTTPGAVRRGHVRIVLAQLPGHVLVHDHVTANPTVTQLSASIQELSGARRFDTIIAVGGGSAVDTGKILSMALSAGDFSLDAFLAGDSRWDGEPIRMIAVPTTAGTGAEVTPFATLWDGDAKRKLSIGSPRMHPTAALVDPALTETLPWETTLSTGLDAFSQCFEAVCNRSATPITTVLATRGITLITDALPLLRSALTNVEARSAMAEAALLSGLAISQTRTGLAHSMSYPVTAHLGVPHGLACALHLPSAINFMAQTDDGPMRQLAHGLVGAPDAGALTPFILDLYRRLGVAEAVRASGGDIDAMRPYASEMVTPSRADNSPRIVEMGDIERMLEWTATWLHPVEKRR